MDYSAYIEVALSAAKAAKEILYHTFRTAFVIKTKGSHFNLVTEADIECEKKIVSVIRETFPEHNILAEEHDYGKTGSPFTWVIDPLDGTNNFAHRLPHYSISIALAHYGEAVLGVILDPERDELFTAVKGQGAALNNNPIKVSGAATLKESLLITGFYYDRGEKMRQALKRVESFLSLGVIDVRRFGSAALDLCYVACGRADGYFEFMLNPWDFAAGRLIVEEAGGLVTNDAGHQFGLVPSYIVASNGKIHEAMLEILNEKDS
jgi:myo-inositol-1(or 4)-monophosphatase